MRPGRKEHDAAGEGKLHLMLQAHASTFPAFHPNWELTPVKTLALKTIHKEQGYPRAKYQVHRRRFVPYRLRKRDEKTHACLNAAVLIGTVVRAYGVASDDPTSVF